MKEQVNWIPFIWYQICHITTVSCRNKSIFPFSFHMFAWNHPFTCFTNTQIRTGLRVFTIVTSSLLDFKLWSYDCFVGIYFCSVWCCSFRTYLCLEVLPRNLPQETRRYIWVCPACSAHCSHTAPLWLSVA